MCMRRECKNCYKQVECFKKEGKNESKKIKNRGFKNSNIQSQKRTNRKKQRQHAFPAKNAGKVVKAMQSYRSSIDRLDELLDKIKLSGYDSLTSKEKRELQHLSERKR